MKRTLYQLTSTAIFIAMGVALPLAFHAIPGGGQVFLPMHIPVLICGLMLGPWCGAVCGILAPVLSSLFTQMPPAAMLPSMLFELLAYGLVSGLLARFFSHRAHLAAEAGCKVSSRKQLVQTYVALLLSMLTGRIFAGILKALIFEAGSYSLQIWLTASFVTALPGIAIQLVLIPALVVALKKAGLPGKTR